jgi:imidazolonepropionase-like amidohydrolase
MMRLLVPAALVGAAPFLFAQPIVFEGGTLVDGTGAAARRTRVTVRDGRIASVAPDAPIPAGAQVVNAEGHTLIPGLFDLHTHLPYSGLPGLSGDWGKNLKAYLLHGVTSVADFGTYPETFEPMRRLLRDGLAGPRLHLAARMTTPGGHGAEAGRGDFFSLEVTTPAEARAAVGRLLPYSPDAIKVFTDGWRYGAGADMTSMDVATLAEIVKQAHTHGIEVMTHTVTLARAKDAARAGVDVIAHGIGDARADPELIRLLKEHATTYVSTLAVYETKTWPVPALLESFLEPAALRIAARMSNSATPVTAARRRRWDNLNANAAAIFQAGGAIGVGTDAGVTGTLHGRSTLRELELLTGAGLTPLQAISAATSTSAKAIHVDQERGTIEPGKLADVVLIQGAPHERIEDIYKVAGVWMGGRRLDLSRLRRDIASEEVTPMAARNAQASIDDMEGAERTSLGTLRVNATDPGHDNSKMLFQRVARGATGKHALAIQARMGEKERPFAQVWLPLAPGGIEPVDASRFKGIQFEARGQGSYSLILHRRALRTARGNPEADFLASPAWAQVSIPFSKLKLLNPSDLLVVAFEIARPAGSHGWLELDNVRFY